jgi:hypothetical protein
MTWTAKDEARMSELEQQLREMAKRRESAWLALAALKYDLADADGYVSTDKLIQHADALRDALEPFDSGVRAAKD